MQDASFSKHLLRSAKCMINPELFICLQKINRNNAKLCCYLKTHAFLFRMLNKAHSKLKARQNNLPLKRKARCACFKCTQVNLKAR